MGLLLRRHLAVGLVTQGEVGEESYSQESPPLGDPPTYGVGPSLASPRKEGEHKEWEETQVLEKGADGNERVTYQRVHSRSRSRAPPYLSACGPARRNDVTGPQQSMSPPATTHLQPQGVRPKSFL